MPDSFDWTDSRRSVDCSDATFTVVFADENSAEQFAEHFRALGHEVSVEKTGTSKNLPYDVRVVKHMAPSYEGINNFEDVLQSAADRWGGRNDGWGCFSGPSVQ